MLTIRLQRVGRKNDPSFRVVVVDSKRSTKSGKFLEILGSHDNRQKDKTFLKADRIKHWLSVGAKLSDTAHNLLVRKQVIEGHKIDVSKKAVVSASETAVETAAPITPAKVEEDKGESEKKVATEVKEEAPNSAAAEESSEASIEEKAG